VAGAAGGVRDYEMRIVTLFSESNR